MWTMIIAFSVYAVVMTGYGSREDCERAMRDMKAHASRSFNDPYTVCVEGTPAYTAAGVQR